MYLFGTPELLPQSRLKSLLLFYELFGKIVAELGEERLHAFQLFQPCAWVYFKQFFHGCFGNIQAVCVYGAFGGHVTFIKFEEFLRECNRKPGLLYCNPSTASGDTQ